MLRVEGTQALLTTPEATQLWIRWTHGYDLENAVEVFRDRVYEIDVNGSVVIDIGASIGDAALFFISKGATRVFSFEPNPESFALAAANLTRNRVAHRVILSPEAVGRRTGVAPLFFPQGVPNASSLSPSRQARLRWKFDSSVPVGVRSLQTVLDAAGSDPIGLVKIDAQGGEYDIICGSESSTLQRARAFIIEFTDGAGPLVRHLTAAGFRVQAGSGSRGYLVALRPA